MRVLSVQRYSKELNCVSKELQLTGCQDPLYNDMIGGNKAFIWSPMVSKKTPSKSPSASQFALFNPSEPPDAFRKPVEIVHSRPHHQLTLVQRKLMNTLLKNAGTKTMDAEGWWSIPLKDVTLDIGFDSKNRQFLKNAARELMKVVFDWDYLKDSGSRVWKASVLIPEMEIDGLHLRYQISKGIRDQVIRPDIFALINMNIQRKFRKATSLALYEHCVRFVKVGSTGTTPWETLRDILLGLESTSNSYNEFKYFKAKCLKPAIAEINSQSDIFITMEQATEGRAVTTLKFLVAYKSDSSPVDSELEIHSPLVAEIVLLGVPLKEATRHLKEYGAEKIASALAYTQVRINDSKQGRLAKPAAYYRQTLINGWSDSDSIFSKRRSVPHKPSLREKFHLTQLAEAEAYFKECEIAVQDGFIAQYNAQQPTESLKIKKSKTSRAANTSFFGWLALDTWGEPTEASLLSFAEKVYAGSVK
jgi:hypothetical protein